MDVHARVEIRPPWPFRLPGGGLDGVLRRRGSVLERLLRVGGKPVLVRAAQPARDAVVVGAWAADRAAADEAITRMRFALGVDEDLRPFYDAFRSDPLIGRSVRARSHLRITRRPEPFEALAIAVCEQLIDFDRALAIQRRMIARLGRRCAHTGLREPPAAATVAGSAPALLESCGLTATRAIALRRAAREVAAGRCDLTCPDHESGWRRLRTIPGIGRWTLEMLALHGQGRYDQLPAGDLNLLKLEGRLRTGSPHARGTEDQVRERFACYGRWAGLAAWHAMGGPPRRLRPPAAAAGGA